MKTLNTMKHLFIFIALCLLAVAAMAQQNIRVSYDQTEFSLHGDSLATSKFLLSASAHRSLYYNRMSQYVDSLTSTPEGKKTLKEIQIAAWKVDSPDGTYTLDMRRPAPRKTIDLYVDKNFDTSTLSVYEKYAGEPGVYNEPFDEMQWNIVSDSTCEVLGYECVRAETDYHGRHWIAWFAPDVPLPDGPWKLRGLPGLIMKAGTDHGISLVATGIEMTDTAVPAIYQTDAYSKVDRKKALAEEEYFRNNYAASLGAQGIRITNADGTAYEAPKFIRAKHALETDY